MAEPGRFSPAPGPLHAAGNGQTLRGVRGHEPVVEPRVCWRRRAVSGRKRGGKPWEASARRKQCEAVSCAVSLDGVSLRPDGDEEACWREASCGTVSFQDAEGNRLKTLSFGPEAGKATLKAQLAEEVAHIRKVRPDLKVVAVADAAPDNWTFLDELQPDERAVDFCVRTSQRGLRPSQATGTKSTAPSCATTPTASTRSAIRYLRDKATTETAIKVLGRELFRKHRRALREPQGRRLWVGRRGGCQQGAGQPAHEAGALERRRRSERPHPQSVGRVASSRHGGQ